MKKQAILKCSGAVILLCALWGIPQIAKADVLSEVSGWLDSWINQGESLAESLSEPILEELEPQLEQLEQEIEGLSEEIFGALGLPDLNVLESTIELLYSEEGNFVEIDEAMHQIHREITLGKSGGTLSEEGQEIQESKLNSISQTTQTLNEQAQTAQSATVTQEVLKQIALQNSQQGQLMGSLNNEIIDLSVKQDLANVNLANISEGIDSENLARQNDGKASANGLLYKSSLFQINLEVNF